jgi:hypothetical protein
MERVNDFIQKYRRVAFSSAGGQAVPWRIPRAIKHRARMAKRPNVKKAIAAELAP